MKALSSPRVVYLIKVGELTLKGGNIKDFEQRLVQNAQLHLESFGVTIRLRAGRMYIDGPDTAASAIEYALTHLIGIAGWAKAQVIEPTIEAISQAVYTEALIARDKGAKSFKIEARRSNKNFPLTSYEIARKASEKVFLDKILTVDVHKPDAMITVEVRERCFVYGPQQNGNRGLPCGTGGKALLLLSGGIDSPVAGFRMLSRGMKIDCLYFHSYPYTSAEAQKKVEDLANKLAVFGMGTHLHIVSFTKVQEYIRDNAPVDYATVLLRMCMMAIANKLCDHSLCQTIITGESLGQVASQTIENLTVTNSCAEYPVLRPLIGMDKEEIITIAKRIGTFETSILPYEDCCVLFSPRRPVIKAKLQETVALYTSLKIEKLLEEAYQTKEHKKLSWR